MTLPSPQRRRDLTIQIIVVVIVLAIAAGACYLWVIGRKPSNGHSVTYKVDGSASVAVVTYIQADGAATKPEDVRVPWRKKLTIPSGTIVILTVGNPTQIGDITCSILLDGAAWKQESASAPADKASCAGIVP